MIDWNEYFTLSNGKLYWKPGAVISRWGTPIRIYDGAEAGCINNRGYWSIKLKGKRYKRSRIIYEMYHGVILSKKDVIDHYDQNKLNDDPDNLRLITQAENNRNARMRKDNTSGIVGVAWSKCKGKWCAQIQFNKIARARYFDDFISACEQRIIWEVSFGFSENHGCDHVSKNTFCKPEEMP